MTSGLCSCLVAALVLSAPAARAESDADRKARAFQVFERGEAQFGKGHYDAAAKLFEEAWEAWRDPAYLFNIGLAFEKAERWPLAVEWYQRFLEAYPDVPNVSEVRRRHAAALMSRDATRAEVLVTTTPSGARVTVGTDASATCTSPCSLRVDPGPVSVRAVLGDRSAESARSVGPTERWEVALTLEPAVVGEETPVPAPDRTGAIVAWSLGGAALVTGVVFGVMASDSYDEGRALAAKDGGVLERSDYDRLAGLRGDVEDQSLVADVGFGTAVVGAAVGLVLWLVSEPEAAASEAGRATWRF